MNTSQKTLLRQFFSNTFSLPISNIRETYNALGVSNADDAYKLLDKEYNKFNTLVTAEQNKDRLRQIKQKAQAKVKDQLQLIAESVRQKEEIAKQKKLARDKKKREEQLQKQLQNLTRKFMIKLTLKTTHNDKKNNKTYEYTTTKLVGPFEEKISEIDEIIDEYDVTDSGKQTTVENYEVEYMDKALKQKGKPKIKQVMKRGFILKNDWLKHSKDIATYAYDETNDTCVYYQLAEFLINPPSGKPTKFINRQRTSEEAIFNYLSSIASTDEYTEDYPAFEKQSGVSTELISALCKEIKRNLYAYDEDDKCFYCNITYNENNNYCPIVYYKIHGHMYLLNSKDAIRSVAETNKPNAKKLITTSVEDKKEHKLADISIYHINEFNLQNAKELSGGIYLLQKSNITKETLQFISLFKEEPKVKNRDNVIVQISYKNKEGEIVFVACDVNYGENIDYEKIKKVANENNITYVNEGIGSVIRNIIDNSKKIERQSLTDEEKNMLIKEFKSCCNMCKVKTTNFEIDHIVPISAGGSNDIENLQPLCVNCHKQKSKEERELGIYQIADETASCFNKNVYDTVVSSIGFKAWQFVEKVSDIEPKLSYKNDIKKCRRNLMYYSNYSFPVYSVMDTPVEFSGNICCGLYYVVTNNTYPFRGSGWYYEPLVAYGLNNNLIELKEIKLEFIPSNVLPSNHFQKHIDTLLTAFECEPSLQKVSVNAYIGLMGRTQNKSTKSKFTLDEVTASEWLATEEDEEDKTLFIRNHNLETDVMIYEGIECKHFISETTTYPIYALILQMEAMELHKLETLVIKNDGIILDRNTDAIRYCAKKELDICNYYWDDKCTVLKYQTETPKPLVCSKLSNFHRKDTLDLNKFVLNWNISYDYENTVEEKAREIVDSNMSLNIDSPAGTGKSYLTNRVIDYLKEQNRKYMAFSPTNKGARIIGGKTIHSIYYKFKHNKAMLVNILKNNEYIIIDEVSMMCEMFYQLFIMIKKMFPAMKFIIVGDFKQLPPVLDKWTGSNYKNSPALFELCNGNRLQLTKCRRADDTLFNLCKNIGKVDVNGFIYSEPSYLNIAFTHKTRQLVNNACMKRYIKEFNTSYVELPTDASNPKTQNLKLSQGMPVVCHTTNKKMGILNSERFIITNIDNENITVNEHDRDITIKLKDFHKFFYIAFCITVHTSQGETFTDKYTIYDWNHPNFCDAGKYVALSRATNINNIQIA